MRRMATDAGSHYFSDPAMEGEGRGSVSATARDTRDSPLQPATARSIADREEAAHSAPVGEGSASHPTAFVSRLTNTPEAADG